MEAKRDRTFPPSPSRSWAIALRPKAVAAGVAKGVTFATSLNAAAVFDETPFGVSVKAIRFEKAVRLDPFGAA